MTSRITFRCWRWGVFRPSRPLQVRDRSQHSGELGSVRYGVGILTACYRIRKWGAFRPYAGPGGAYALILKEHDAAVSQLSVHNSWGFVTAGRSKSIRLAKKWELFADYKKVWLAVDAKGLLSGGVASNSSCEIGSLPRFGRNQVSLLLGHRTLNFRRISDAYQPARIVLEARPEQSLI